MARARQTNALQKYERSKQLVEKGHTSQAQLDNVQTTLDVAKAEVQMRVAELKTANQNLTDTLVLAPFDAAITRRYNDEGVYLSTGARTGTGSAVLQLQENHIVVAVVRAPESALARLSVNMKALVYIQGQDEPRRSVVYAINDMLDIASRTIELRIGIENKGYAIKSGQFARAALIVGEVPVLTLPKAVIMNGVDGKFILVIRNGVAHKTHVEVQDEGLPTLVILQGVTASDSDILNERNLVSDGDRVRAGAN
jgi:RND family efflux transporter MFP subunit